MSMPNGYRSQSRALPSAQSLPESFAPNQHHHRQHQHPYHQQQQYQQQRQYQPQQQYQQQQHQYGVQCLFQAGTHPDVIRAFQFVDRDRSGFIDQFELQQALSSAYFTFHLRTIRLLMFLFSNHNNSSRIGPMEFNALWTCLGHWRSIFERFDRDRSGKIDAAELRDTLHSIGYATSPSVLQVIMSRYDKGRGQKVELNFDSFVECGMIVKGLTEKFKEKDTRYTGSATLSYETFMSMIIPFVVA